MSTPYRDCREPVDKAEFHRMIGRHCSKVPLDYTVTAHTHVLNFSSPDLGYTVRMPPWHADLAAQLRGQDSAPSLDTEVEVPDHSLQVPLGRCRG